MAQSRVTFAAALLVALSAWSGLAIQTGISIVDEGGLGPGLIRLSRYFTILTTTGVALAFTAILLRRHVPHGVLTGVLLATLITGIVYHLLLAHKRSLAGIDLAADHLLHSATPALAFAFWLGFVPKSPLRGRTPLYWLVWPLVYCIYGVGRGMVEGLYPYYFINLAELGWAGLALSIGRFAGAFAVGGYALWGLNQVLAGRARETRQAQSSPG